ncbi:unnamed protein product [Adineta ricciae]|nr:unnamed protein product [Adineta ricciae]
MAGFQTDESLLRNIDAKIKQLGRTNIIVVGRTGVGKSTLINAVFKEDVATTGTGSPVTKNIQKYVIPGTSVTLYDSRGLEMKEYKKIMDEVCSFIKQCQKNKDINEHIHIAWMCISQTSNRLEEGEIAFVEMISKYIPVIIVITQSYDEDNTLFNVIQQKFQDPKVIPVVAKEKIIRSEYPPIPSAGLPILVKMTQELLPAAQQIAFLAAQNADFSAKILKAHAIVGTSAIAAAAAGAIPIPFSDMAVLIPIEIGMIISITAVLGFEIERSVIIALWGIFSTASGASVVGLGLASLLKFIPGVGSIAGGIIDAAVATSITTAFGEAYIGILVVLFNENNGAKPTKDQFLAKCKQEWKKKQDS